MDSFFQRLQPAFYFDGCRSLSLDLFRAFTVLSNVIRDVLHAAGGKSL